MRIGQNPSRMDQASYQPNRIGIAILVYIPHQAGYFEQALQVLELMLDSIEANTTQPFDLCVFDNGCCDEVKSVLQGWQAQGRIEWLLSVRHNLGKTGALNWIFGAMPNELIVFSDSDVFFRPGWLEESLKILEGFPGAGMVGAQPCFYDVLKGSGKAQEQIGPDTARFDYSPSRALIEEYAASLGYSEDLVERYAAAPLPALRSALNGAEAVLLASHMQFLIPREAARAILPLPTTKALLPQETQAIDRRIDAAGYLHLSTLRSLVLHMGNVYDPKLRAELEGGPVPSQPKTPSAPPPEGKKALLARLARSRFLRPLIYRLYKALFEVYAA